MSAATPTRLWSAPSVAAPIHASVPLPGSKSLTNRFLVVAALGEEPVTLRRPLRARDTDLMVQALTRLGATIDDRGQDWVITPGPLSAPADIDCGLAGNVMRFVPAIAGLAEGTVSFDGDPRARERPLAPLVSALKNIGVVVVDDGRGQLPFSIEGRGHVRGGAVELDSGSSSQFLSALLLAGCRYDDGVTIQSVGGTIPSEPHVAMTVAVLQAAGVDVQRTSDKTWHVSAGVPQLGETRVEPDLSNALPFFAAALLTGGSCTIPNWPSQTVQPLPQVTAVLNAMGADVQLDSTGLTVSAGQSLRGADLDMSDLGELVPTVAAIATSASSPSTLRGVAHLRGHETDRLAALAREFNALGGDVTETDDGLVIIPRRLSPGTFHSYADHRMATAGALVGLTVPGIQVDDVETTDKTLPNFTQLWHDMLESPAA